MKKMFIKLYAIARSDSYVKGAVGFATAIIANIVMAFPAPGLVVTATFIRLAAAILLLALAMKLNESRNKPVKVDNYILAGMAAGVTGALSNDVSYWLLKFVVFVIVALAVKIKK